MLEEFDLIEDLIEITCVCFNILIIGHYILKKTAIT